MYGEMAEMARQRMAVSSSKAAVTANGKPTNGSKATVKQQERGSNLSYLRIHVLTFLATKE